MSHTQTAPGSKPRPEASFAQPQRTATYSQPKWLWGRWLGPGFRKLRQRTHHPVPLPCGDTVPQGERKEERGEIRMSELGMPLFIPRRIPLLRAWLWLQPHPGQNKRRCLGVQQPWYRDSPLSEVSHSMVPCNWGSKNICLIRSFERPQSK